MSLKNRIWLFVSLWTALALRLNRLDGQSLWNDEGTSIALSALNLDAIARGAAHDIHPPLYYILLHFWMGLAGQSEFAVRFLSVLAGVGIVALTFRLARAWFDEEVGLIAAFLSALSAFQVYYSQETRMYIWVAFWGALSLFALYGAWFRRLGRNRAGWLALYLAATLAALYSHYFAAAIVVFENLLFGIVWLARRAPRPVSPVRGLPPLAMWIGGQVVVGVAFLPWWLFAGGQVSAWPAISEPFTLPDLIGRVLGVFATGGMLGGAQGQFLTLAIAVFFLAGFWRSRDQAYPWAWVLAAGLWVVVPVLLLYTVSLQRPAYNPKFLLLATPGFFVLTGRGLSLLYPGLFLRERYPASPRLANWLSPRTVVFVLAVGMAATLIVALQNYYGDPTYARDDYRTAVRYINRVAGPDDVVLVNAPGQLDVVKYYLHTPAAVMALPVGRPLNLVLTLQQFNEQTAGRRRLYALLYATEQSDPENVVGNRLEEEAYLASTQWYGNVRLAQYALPAAMPPTSPESLGVVFGDEIALDRLAVGNRSQRPGDILPLRFSWRALRAPTQRYKIFVHLLDAQSRVVAQHDAEPFDGARPTDTWRPGPTLDERFGVVVGPDLAPGTYELELGLYGVADNRRLPITDAAGRGLGDRVLLGSVTVVASSGTR